MSFRLHASDMRGGLSKMSQNRSGFRNGGRGRQAFSTMSNGNLHSEAWGRVFGIGHVDTAAAIAHLRMPAILIHELVAGHMSKKRAKFATHRYTYRFL